MSITIRNDRNEVRTIKYDPGLSYPSGSSYYPTAFVTGTWGRVEIWNDDLVYRNTNTDHTNRISVAPKEIHKAVCKHCGKTYIINIKNVTILSMECEKCGGNMEIEDV